MKKPLSNIQLLELIMHHTDEAASALEVYNIDGAIAHLNCVYECAEELQERLLREGE